ncbi:MAG TPA: lamin tail domain-containing protein [Flavisolibacter sp.]|nr:lamin tail domain-containing protein [Flavisolibacter sp.]
MRTQSGRILSLLLLCFSLLSEAKGQATGRVVINEYLPWTSNGCSVSSEFVELLNFGPGPVDLGCYILTNGNRSITIPPNTILEPGQFYVLGGQDVIPKPCANVDSTITVHLNWNSCNCTNLPIDGASGFLADEATANEKLVLFDANMNIIDAVARSLPVLPSTSITTSSVGGGCTTKTFNLDNLPVNYEVLGMSTGRGNSFARTMDGDCVWVKDPQQSANASNNKAGKTSDITYAFVVDNALDCDSTDGTVSIYVKHNDYSKVFPMNYILVIDTNKNGRFDLNDKYTYGYDDAPPEIRITGLPVGYFRVTVSSVQGCYLKSFDFTILPCYPTLPVKLIYFKYAGFANNKNKLEWMLTDIEHLKSVVVEKGVNNGSFIPYRKFEVADGLSGSKYFSSEVDGGTAFRYYRLKIISKDGQVFYSPVITGDLGSSLSVNKYWPNPTIDKLNIQLQSQQSRRGNYTIYNVTGSIVGQGQLDLKAGTNNSSVPVNALPSGVYQLQIINDSPEQQPVSFRFVKH